MVGNHSQSVKAQGSLTARPTSRAGTKVGLSDPVVPHGRAIALETGELECRRGKWNSKCSGEMRRDLEEHQWRRRLSGL